MDDAGSAARADTVTGGRGLGLGSHTGKPGASGARAGALEPGASEAQSRNASEGHGDKPLAISTVITGSVLLCATLALACLAVARYDDRNHNTRGRNGRS